MVRTSIVWALVLVALICSAEAAEVDVSSKSAESLEARGQTLFAHYCAHCHGIKGEGNGYNAEFLDKEPANLSDKEFVSKKSNEQLFRVITLGGVGVKKSSLMPVFGNTISEEDIWALIAYVRKLAGDDSHPVNPPPSASKSRPEVTPANKDSFQKLVQLLSVEDQKKNLVKQGEHLFKKEKSCLACHRVGNVGGKVGPEFSRAGFLYKPEWLFTWIPNPQRIKQNTIMPSISLSGEELMAITAYLSDLKKDSGKLSEWRPYLEKAGDPKQGEALFFDLNGKATCSKCHQVNGKGGQVGPNLSFIGSSRTNSFILESILDPKAVITVGYASVSVMTREGNLLSGIRKAEDDASIDLVDKDGKQIHISKDQIKKMKTQSISMMPSNFKEILGVDEIRDILAYLETLKSPLSKEYASVENTRLSMK